MIGKEFGIGSVIRFLESNKHQHKVWELRCECGTLYKATTGSLNSGNTKSCGCVRNKKTKDINWKGCGEIPKVYYTQLKKSAEKRGIEFDISIEDIWNLFISQNRKCSLSNVELYFTKGKERGTASLDRIDSNLGYNIDNIQWIHKDINKTKSNLDQDDYIDICRNVAKYNSPALINNQKPKIVVFGGGGYIGNVMCRYLLDIGYNVRCVDNFHKGQCDSLLELITNPSFEFRFGDITVDSDIIKNIHGVDAIINLAAIVGFPACKTQPSLAQAINEDAAKRMVELKKDSIPLFFASTGSVYGKIEDICTEQSPTNPKSLYGTTKLNAEQYISEFENTLSYRFATCFGVSANMRVNLLINDFVYHGIANRCLAVFQPDFNRTFIHIRDFVRSIVFGLENIHNFSHKVYNVGSNDLNWTKRQIAEYLSHKIGCTVFYSDFAEDLDQRDYSVSYDLINKEGFKCHVGMEKGIDELIKVSPLLQIKHQYM